MQTWWDERVRRNARPAPQLPPPPPPPPPPAPLTQMQRATAALTAALRSTRASTIDRMPPLSPRTRRGLAVVAVLSSGLLAWSAFEYWRSHRRARTLRSLARGASMDLESLVTLLYALAPQHLGGCLSNAQIRAVERTAPDVITIFASGGWRFQPHSLTGLPMAAGAAAPASDSAEDRLRFWIASTVGKGTTLNGSLGFLLAMLALEAEKSGGEGAPLEGVTFRGRRIAQVGMCTGTLYTSIASLQRTAESRSNSSASAAASSAAAALPNCVSCAPVSRVDIVCELGTISPTLLRAFQQRHWGYIPDPRSEQLGEICEFGTTAVLDHWRATGSFPLQASPQFENVFYSKREMNVPPHGKDQWVWIEVESEESAAAAKRAGEQAAAAGGKAAGAAAAAASPILSTTRIHIDTSIFFARGLSAGFRDDAARSSDSAGAAGGAGGLWASLSSGWSRVTRKLGALSPFQSAEPASAPSAAAAVHALPHPLLLPESLVLDSRGLSSRIDSSVSGGRAVVGHLQSAVLINSDPANSTHTQMRGVLLEALALCGLKNRLLTHKIDLKPHKKSKRRAATQQQQQQHQQQHSSHSPSESSATSSGRTSASPEAQQSDDDEDDGAIAVDTDEHRHNVEQLD